MSFKEILIKLLRRQIAVFRVLLVAAASLNLKVSLQHIYLTNISFMRVVDFIRSLNQRFLKIALSVLVLLFSGLAIADEANVTWVQLTEAQRRVLNPLALEWDTLRPWQREKMLDIARDYPKMSTKKQALVQERLSNWSRMTPYERENARKRHQQFQSLPEDKKNELGKKWQEYQKLPETERARLRSESPDAYSDADLD
jgi:hypothetical protein